jgi:hypothetical protein
MVEANCGTTARRAHALDETTRTMAVELDVMNLDQALAPGMYVCQRQMAGATR